MHINALQNVQLSFETLSNKTCIIPEESHSVLWVIPEFQSDSSYYAEESSEKYVKYKVVGIISETASFCLSSLANSDPDNCFTKFQK